MKWIKRAAVAAVVIVLVVAVALFVASRQPSLHTEEAVRIATDAYIYGYPLVTFDMARRQQTNVAAPDGEHAPMGQMIKMRSYPAVDNHCCAAPNADTLYTIAWLDVGAEPWVFSIPEMGDRYYIMPMLDGFSEVIHVASASTTGGRPQSYAITGPGWSGSLAGRRDRGEVRHRDGVGPGPHLLHGHGGGLRGGARAAGPVLGGPARRLRQALYATGPELSIRSST